MTADSEADGFWAADAEEEEEEQPQAEPKTVGSGEHVVKPGECVESIAYARGHFWETVWEHAGNAELKNARDDPNTLLPGDRVFVPELRRKTEALDTNEVHRFRRKGVPSMLRIIFRRAGEPRANEAYVFEAHGIATKEGMTDADGLLEEHVPPDVLAARVTFRQGTDEEDVYDFTVGTIDPVREVSGAQQRLDNLGYSCADSGQLDDETRSAIAQFQIDEGVEPTGELDDDTVQALTKEYE